MGSSTVALIYVYVAPLDYLLNDMLKRDFISRLIYSFFCGCFSFICCEGINFLSFMKMYVHIYFTYTYLFSHVCVCVYFHESHSGNLKYWSGMLHCFVGFPDIKCLKLRINFGNSYICSDI